MFVSQLGGPSWNVGLGRRDSTTASKDAATKDIPSPLMDLSALISAFANKGFNSKEMVALSGKLELLSSKIMHATLSHVVNFQSVLSFKFSCTYRSSYNGASQVSAI